MVVCYLEATHVSFTGEVILVNDTKNLPHACAHTLHGHGGSGNIDDILVDPDWIFEGFPHELIEKTLFGNLSAAALTVNQDSDISNFPICAHANNKGKRVELSDLLRNNCISLNSAVPLSYISSKSIFIQPPT